MYNMQSFPYQYTRTHLEGLFYSLYEYPDGRRASSLIELQVVGSVQDLTEGFGCVASLVYWDFYFLLVWCYNIRTI